jgi:hypothetical protein
MEGPTKAAEGLSVVHMNGGRNMLNNSGTITLRRKSAKRTEPWYNNLTSPATKKPRFETAMATATATAKGATKTASHDVAMTLSPPANADDDANNDPKPRATSTGATYTGRWTPEEDAILTHAVTNTYKKQYGKEWKIDWVAIIPLIPGRTKTQCQNRWQNALSRRIDRTAGRSGVWTEAEDMHLKDAVHMHGAKDWGAIAALVPNRTINQCNGRWHSTWKIRKHTSIDRTAGRTGTWTKEEDDKLKDAIQMHGGKDWDAIAALVPGRTRSQCSSRWHNAWAPSIDRANGRKGMSWTADEDIKLKNAVRMHGGKKWFETAALVPGRTHKQCWDRWQKYMDPNRSAVRGK